MEPSSSWPLTIIKRYSISYCLLHRVVTCTHLHKLLCSFIGERVDLCFLTSCSLQLLSKQIGISGHIHRLVAGSMAGKLLFDESVPVRYHIQYWQRHCAYPFFLSQI